MSSSKEPMSSSIDESGREVLKEEGRSALSSSTPHYNFFVWLDDYVALFEELRNSPFMEGWKLDQSQILNAAVVDAEKLRELEGRVTGLELEAKNCNTNSGTSCVNVKVMVITFVFGIMISKLV
ncbi:hypothetical protein AHAS_Ahas09G0190800 [Arachis hypogaea]